MRFGVIRFPGSNCDDDALHAVDRVLAADGASGRMIWHKEQHLGELDAVIVPGGFSYGDYLRGGAMAARAPIMADLVRFAERGGPVLGICNGFQILCEAGLLEGALTRNASLRFVCKDVFCVVEGRPTPFTSAIPAGRHLRLPIAHAEGCYVHEDPAALERAGQVVFRYCDAAGAVTPEANPNGSLAGIAGVCNPAGNVVGLMPHPERALEPLLGSGDDGRMLFLSALAQAAGRPTRVGG
ncbi:phosphoribosylformylglycinamidine synthase subunit PurQ [Haliangium ochraceum]|uniref:Phosphoribosylformylglycinamidine synthase subunit PurQ n=1 Tax=Haliangium ochraceum (strain DSM 14365 / JCM 11303 / SMP-2) TaxID=502025 RepID=D0LZ78_HALO1|nr:phosphoribosylformylglycinamidine synthase subunit PurQ [Haliangium ochraceum]ACY16340.1 phosphoribosylformylglycinamidine synthase I [Haliangium ochraceum DSM 14365]